MTILIITLITILIIILITILIIILRRMTTLGFPPPSTEMNALWSLLLTQPPRMRKPHLEKSDIKCAKYCKESRWNTVRYPELGFSSPLPNPLLSNLALSYEEVHHNAPGLATVLTCLVSAFPWLGGHHLHASNRGCEYLWARWRGWLYK
jgi:hypothetical protein